MVALPRPPWGGIQSPLWGGKDVSSYKDIRVGPTGPTNPRLFVPRRWASVKGRWVAPNQHAWHHDTQPNTMHMTGMIK